MNSKQRINTDNKGFSLVELIVVVLIMGILTVGLTPQVLKWVTNARKANDLNYMHSLEAAVSYALMDSDVIAEVMTAVDASGTDDTIGGSESSKLLKKTASVLGFETDDASIQKFKDNKIKTTGGVIEIHINGGRAVGTYKVNGSEVDMTNE